MYAVKGESWRAINSAEDLQEGETLYETVPDFPVDNWLPIREKRDARLAQCDWTQLLDAALTLEQRAAWSEYRQALRDLPQAFENPEDVIFPTTPGGA